MVLIKHFSSHRLPRRVKAGFTLLEMLIVISIVGVIAGIAVGSYGSIRQQAKLDIATDSFVSAFHEQFQKTRSGKSVTGGSSSSDFSSSCFGLKIALEAPYLEYRSTPYVSADTLRADVCDPLKVVSQPYDFMEEVVVKNIEVELQGLPSAPQSTEVFFKPPLAKAVLLSEQSYPKPFTVTVTLGVANVPSTRTVQFDSLTGVARKIANIQP